ncbi:MAG: roadblock/LC7 domain-containing protein [Thermoleophilia bacterium]
MEQIVAPYLEVEGVAAAALVSRDGLLVASAGGADLGLDALAAYSASIMSSAMGLSQELGTDPPSSLALEFPVRKLTLALLTDELLLMLVGSGKRSG